MKRYVQILWMAMAVVLFALPFPLSYVMKNVLDQNNYENRELASFPSLTLEDITGFAAQFEDFFNDHLPFRNELISGRGLVSVKLFQESPSKSAILGKDGWLFYNGKEAGDGDPVADYAGTNLYTEQELEELKNSLVQNQEALTERGIQFAVMIAPNKETVYADKMPDHYGEPTAYSKAEQIYEYLKQETDLTIVYAENALKQAREDYPEYDYYYHLDTHWNSLGGYVGTKCLLDELGIDMPGIGDLTLEQRNVSGYDLAGLMNLRQYLQDDVDYDVSGYCDQEPQALELDSPTILHYASAEGIPEKLLMIRDSFATALVPYFAAEFQESYFEYIPYYTSELLEEVSPDLVVVEIAERSLDNLKGISVVE